MKTLEQGTLQHTTLEHITLQQRKVENWILEHRTWKAIRTYNTRTENSRA